MSRSTTQPTQAELEVLAALATEATSHGPGALALEGEVQFPGVDQNGKDIKPPTVAKVKNDASASLRNVKLFGEAIIQQYKIVHIHGTKHFYILQGTHYVRRDPLFFGGLFEASDYKYLSNKKNNDELILFLKRSCGMSREDFNASTEGFINFQNGHFNKKTKTLTPHSECPTEKGQVRYFTYCLPFNYDPNALAPQWDNFMKQCFMNKKTGRVDLGSVNCLHEFMGYTLSGDENWADKMLLAVGPSGANGKGTIWNIMRRLLGDDAYSAIPAATLGSETGRFGLTGKLANLSAEEPVDAFVKNEAIIKSLTSKDAVSARALHNDGGKLSNRAKLWFSCNEALTSHDISGGFLRRPLVLVFMNKAVDPADYELESQEYKHGCVYKKDIHLEEKLAAELPGIFNNAMAAYEEAKRAGQLTIPQASKDAVQEMADSDLVTEIVRCAFEESPTDKPLTNRDIMLAFQHEMDLRKIRTQITQKRVTAAIKSVFMVTPYRTKTDRGFYGIRTIHDLSVNQQPELPQNYDRWKEKPGF